MLIQLGSTLHTRQSGRSARIYPKWGATRAVQYGGRFKRVYNQRAEIFPKEEAYEGGLLRFLLREILHKYKGDRKRNRP
jgi:hypothetical protein